MTTASSAPDYGRRIRFLMFGVIAAIAAWTGGWFWLAGTVETRARAAFDSARVGCTDLQAFGYPFRIGIRCTKTGFRFGDGDDAPFVEGLNLRTAAQIYRPSLVIAEVDAPVVFTMEQSQTTIEFESARASVRGFDGLPDRLSVVVAKPSVQRSTKFLLGTLEGLPQTAKELQFHMRRVQGSNGNETLEASATIADLSINQGVRTEIFADAVLDDAAAIMASVQAGEGFPLVARGRKGELRAIRISSPEGGPDSGTLSVRGTFATSSTGLLDADLTLEVTDAASLAQWLPGVIGMNPSDLDASGSFGIDRKVLSTMLGVLPPTGASSFEITIRNGNASIGLIPLGTVPAI
jgi:hypothetical protein